MTLSSLNRRHAIKYVTERQTDERPYQSTVVTFTIPGQQCQFKRGEHVTPSKLFEGECDNTYLITRAVYAAIAQKTLVSAVRHCGVSNTDTATLLELCQPAECEQPDMQNIAEFCSVLSGWEVVDGVASARLYIGQSAHVERLLPLTQRNADWYIKAFASIWKPQGFRDLDKLESPPYIDVTQVPWPLATT